MGDVAYYNANLKAEIDIKGNKTTKRKSKYILNYDIREDDDTDDLIEKIVKIIEENGLNELHYISIGDEYWVSEEDIKKDFPNIEKMKDWILETFDYMEFEYEKFGEIELVFNTAKNVDIKVLEKVENIDSKFEIINDKAVIYISEISESIYCDNDNSCYDEINITKLKSIFDEFPKEKIKMFLIGDGSAYC